MKKVVLGFDVSTSIIGVCAFKEKKFDKMFNIDLRKCKCFFEKTRKTKLEVKKILDEYSQDDIDSIYVEDIMQSFSRGLSSAKTLTQLARFNGIVSYILYDISGLTPVYLNVNSARKLLGVKIDKNSKIDKKEQVMNFVSSELGEKHVWETKIVSRGANKGSVKFEQYCYDMADAYIICKAGIINNDIQITKKI